LVPNILALMKKREDVNYRSTQRLSNAPRCPPSVAMIRACGGMPTGSATYTLALPYGFVVVPEPLSIFRVEQAPIPVPACGTRDYSGKSAPRFTTS
jgi:hypothetical protein